MANSDIINHIIEMTTDMLVYLLPVIALMTGITLVLSFLLHVTLGASRRIFRG